MIRRDMSRSSVWGKEINDNEGLKTMTRGVPGKRMRILTVHLPDAYVEALDELVRKRVYPNRSEAIRMAVRDFIQREARAGWFDE